MSEVFLVYLWLKLDTVSNILIAVGILLPTIVFFWNLVASDLKDDAGWSHTKEAKYIRADYRKRHKQLWWSMIFMAIFCFLVGHLLPTPKQAAALVGTHYAVKLAGSPEGQKVMTLIRKKANDYLDEQLKEEVKK